MERRPSFREAFLYWLKLGFVNFGGPAGQIAMMHRDLVERKKWISEERFLHALNYCMLLPGPEATQLAIYVGWLMHRTLGGIVAGVLFVLPSIFALLALSLLYVTFGTVPVVAGALLGLKAAVLAIVAHALVRIARRGLRTFAMAGLAALAFVSLFLLGAPFPLVILGAGLIGFFGARLAPSAFPAPPAQPASHMPEHTKPGMRRALAVLAVGALVWLVPLLLLVFVPGPERVFLNEAAFFSGAALVTFGGAYAVLTYMAQAAVETHGWLTAPQMVDGLGLAESTPGPLIMVVCFVGFMGGWTFHGGLPPWLAGVLGGLVATYFTFVPSFLFVFLGAPSIERVRGHRALSTALAAITAAVVGVILNLAVFFAQHVLWTGTAVDWFAVVVAVGALGLLIFAEAGVVLVILIGLAAGVGKVVLAET